MYVYNKIMLKAFRPGRLERWKFVHTALLILERWIRNYSECGVRARTEKGGEEVDEDAIGLEFVDMRRHFNKCFSLCARME